MRVALQRFVLTSSYMAVVCVVAQMSALPSTASTAAHRPEQGTQNSQGPFGVDSAGVRLITISPAEISALPLWRIEPTQVRIGTGRTQPDYLINRSGLPWRLANGNIVFPNDRTELRIYNSAGVHVRTAGRFGPGPGEFSDVHSLRPGVNDSILLLETGRRRVSVFAASGAFVRMFTIAGTTGVGPFGPRWLGSNRLVTGVSPAGTTLASAQPTVAMDSMFVVVRSLAGTDADTVGRIARVSSRRSPEGRISIEFYGDGPQLAAGTSSFATSERDAFRVRWYDSTGRLLRIVRSPEMTNEIPMDSIVAFEAMVSARAGQGRVPLQQYPRRGPLITGLVIDRLDRLWIKQWAPSSATVAQWIILDPSGRPLARVSTPASLTFADAGGDYLLGRVKGDLDVESIIVYSIRR